jgi:hypothetical protein
MNIFYLDENPIKAANLHCIRHTKMILESAQMLSTCVNLQICNSGLYKSTHINHPCTKWVCESKNNFMWVYTMASALCDNYKNRHNGIEHKSRAILDLACNYINQLSFMSSGLTYVKQVMPEQYQLDNPVKAYLNYYINDKSKLFSINDGNLLKILQEKFYE